MDIKPTDKLVFNSSLYINGIGYPNLSIENFLNYRFEYINLFQHSDLNINSAKVILNNCKNINVENCIDFKVIGIIGKLKHLRIYPNVNFIINYKYEVLYRFDGFDGDLSNFKSLIKIADKFNRYRNIKSAKY